MLTVLARLILAAVSGGITFLAVEPRGWWAAGIFGVALLVAALSPWRHAQSQSQPSLAWSALIATVHSAVLYLCMLPWIGELVGNMPYIALAVFLSLYSILLGIGGAALLRWRHGFALFPFFYVAVELLRSSVPFGGFSWVRLAWGQIEGPLAHLAPWGGPALISFAVVCVAAGLVGLARAAVASGYFRRVRDRPAR